MKYPSPFVKWAGGKKRLLPQYEAYFPSSFEGYVEPFAGGGAVFFYLHRQGTLRGKPSFLLDRVEELVNCYRVIQDQVEDLISALATHESHKGEPDYYYEIRGWDRVPGYALRGDVERAARFMFLNHTCYNGLYRVNRRGQFNVPMGRYDNPTICNDGNLRAVHEALQGVDLQAGDFELCLDWARSGDFVYLDPPYHPRSDTACFTSYTSRDFGAAQQTRLANLFRELDQRGCRLMLSNSDTDLIRELYAAYEQIPMRSGRAINSKPGGRGLVSELLIVNRYERSAD